jgi:hypothetical protein
VAKADLAMRQLAYSVTGKSQLRLSTSVHLFKTLVRPVLEYGAGVWGAMCSKAGLRKLERVQEQFGRKLLHLHHRSSRVFLRSELGLESIKERVQLATLRFYGRLTEMPEEKRLAGFLFRRRCEQVEAGGGKLSWCKTAKRLLKSLGQEEVWQAEAMPEDWRRTVKERLCAKFKSESKAEMKSKPLLGLYSQLGPPTVGGWLDCAVRHPGAALREKLRSGWLPLMDAIGESKEWPSDKRKCRICGTGAVETAEHFAAVCPFNGQERANCLARIEALLGDKATPPLRQAIADADVALFLGDRWLRGLPKEMAKAVDRTVCNFLKVAWWRRTPRWLPFCHDNDEWNPKAD